ncbi:hypothetical protein VCHC51A1_2124 [Vibrio cholerae HC-51A1]|nr:hypothetical protein VCLMA_A1784 [Vibrio cholerae LMA3984-4]APF60607.1 hypothetical protein ASZ84_01598 [Vibrio cholerae]EGS57628.1 hypothetical protein VCHE09_2386 [Vibrio paracholerae HE-09]EGS68334.1 hypothetical protein VCBJG01_2077 [Vibrio cholerae BJG-01]EJH51000.1 hypothetical protein VCHC43B1_2919 [Vibrio cholerae HC-43B1]EJH64450.1 hypothetical protein VCHE45_2066 [Vibrio cholerae HE-45]EKG49865.1 hypothetical protein VCHC50A1_2228 [Vibrio cholerae HC-50A1]EKG55438.1 hypothetical
MAPNFTKCVASVLPKAELAEVINIIALFMSMSATLPYFYLPF